MVFIETADGNVCGVGQSVVCRSYCTSQPDGTVLKFSRVGKVLGQGVGLKKQRYQTTATNLEKGEREQAVCDCGHKSSRGAI